MTLHHKCKMGFVHKMWWIISLAFPPVLLAYTIFTKITRYKEPITVWLEKNLQLNHTNCLCRQVWHDTVNVHKSTLVTAMLSAIRWHFRCKTFWNKFIQRHQRHRKDRQNVSHKTTAYFSSHLQPFRRLSFPQRAIAEFLVSDSPSWWIRVMWHWSVGHVVVSIPICSCVYPFFVATGLIKYRNSYNIC